MTDKPRLLWHSNSPFASTGYANQTSLFALPLKERFEFAISCFYGVEGQVIPWNGVPLLPGIGQTYGNETILDHASVFFGGDLRGGLVCTLMDVWVLEPSIWRQLNACSWVPVDHTPAPDPVVGFFKESGAVPIAMSKFGQGELREAGLDPLYVPHAVDTSVYKPMPRKEAREITDMPSDAFICGMVAANKGNPSRKCFVEAFQAFKILRERHKDALLYLHTEVMGKFDGVNIPKLMGHVGLDSDAVLICDQYRAVHRPFPPEKMAAIYSSLDVLLAPSAGEGFGIPVVEANACGVPAIVSDFSAQPEVLGAGWKVEGVTHYTRIGAWQFLPDIEDIHEALTKAYTLPDMARKQAAKKARAHALTYDVNTVLTEYMLPALAEAQERCDDAPPTMTRKPAKQAA